MASEKFQVKMTAYDLRKIYRGQRITKQKVQSMLSPFKPKSTEEQTAQLSLLKEQYSWFAAHGFEIIQYDACTFSPNQYYKYQWAPVGTPLLTRQKYIQHKLVCVLGFISAESGKIYFHIRQQTSFKKEDVVRCIKRLGRRFQDEEIVLFGDNARIHRNESVTEAAADDNINMVFNIPYRPDLMGIEGVWRIAKDLYKREIARMHVNQLRIDNLQVVEWVFMQITDDQCKHEARSGWKRLLEAQPKQYEDPVNEALCL